MQKQRNKQKGPKTGDLLSNGFQGTEAITPSLLLQTNALGGYVTINGFPFQRHFEPSFRHIFDGVKVYADEKIVLEQIVR